jgi:hypothetical protein
MTKPWLGLVKVLIATPITRASARMQEPRGVNERLDPRHGEAQHQVHLPQSFMLTDTIHTFLDTSNPKRASIITIRLSISSSRIHVPNSVLGATG